MNGPSMLFQGEITEVKGNLVLIIGKGEVRLLGLQVLPLMPFTLIKIMRCFRC